MDAISESGSTRRTRWPRLGPTLLALVAVVALLASACSSSSESNTAGGSDFITGPPASDPAAAPTDEDLPLSGSASSDSNGSKAPSGTTSPAEFTSLPAASVLAYAIEQTDELSYSFDMGMATHMSMMGMEIDMAPAGPVMSGAVQGDRMYMAMDLGELMSSLQASGGLGGEVPPIPQSQVGDMVVEVWLDGTVMTIDMSAMADLDPTIGSPFEGGPISVDVSTLEGVGLEDISSEVLDSAGMMGVDPTAMADLLRGLEVVTDAGTDVVDGRAVTVYRGAMSMAEYFEAMGEDLGSAFESVEGLGAGAGGEDMIDAMLPSFEAAQIELAIMIDEDELLRRMEIFMDMSPMFQAMYEPLLEFQMQWSSDDEGATSTDEIEKLLADITMTMDMWMEFSNYGETVVEAAPPANDAGEEFAWLFG